MKIKGKKIWVFTDSNLEGKELNELAESDDTTVIIINQGKKEAKINLTVFFMDKRGIGPLEITVPANKSKYIRFNSTSGLPKGIKFSCFFISNVPVLMQQLKTCFPEKERLRIQNLSFFN